MKATFATLKKYASRDQLSAVINSEFDGMVDGMTTTIDPKPFKVTLEDLVRFKCGSNNTLRYYPYRPNDIELYNCCYDITFTITTNVASFDPEEKLLK